MAASSKGIGPTIFPVRLDPTTADATVYYYGQPGGNIITLDKDLVAGDLVFQGNLTINTNGYRIFCNNLSAMGGVLITNSGGNAVQIDPYTVGAGGIANTLGGGRAGGLNGKQLVDPVREDAPVAGGTVRFGGLGGNGGAGGNSGAAGGTSTLNYVDSGLFFGQVNGIPYQQTLFSSGMVIASPDWSGGGNLNAAATVVGVAGGAGGGGGKANTVSQSHGGSGGGGGGVVFIACSGVVSLTGNSQITASGGNGGAGLTAGGVTGGGGGGGGGGAVIISCSSMSMSDTCGIFVRGGTAGSGGGAVAADGLYGWVLVWTPNGAYAFNTPAIEADDYPLFPVS